MKTLVIAFNEHYNITISKVNMNACIDALLIHIHFEIRVFCIYYMYHSRFIGKSQIFMSLNKCIL